VVEEGLEAPEHPCWAVAVLPDAVDEVGPRQVELLFGDRPAGMLQEVSGVGPRMAEQITAFFREPHNAEVLDELLKRVVLIETAPAEPSAAASASVLPLAGQKWVFTGGLTHLTRRDAQEKIEALGARATGSVSKSTTVVVIGEDAGSKADDAQKLGIKTMNEDELLAFLRGNGIEV